MVDYASFYPIIKNNRDTEPSCDLINQSVANHPKTRMLHISDIISKKASIYNRDNPRESIFFVKIGLLVAMDAQSPTKKFEFHYIPIVKNSLKYYILIKDSEAFYNTNLANFVFNVLNYNVIYNIAKPTHNNSNIIDILMRSLMVYMQIQNEEVAKIVTNMLANSAIFVNDLDKENKQLTKIFQSQSYCEYVRKNNILMKQIIGNNNLIYGIDYELTTKQACELLGIEPIPVFPPRKYNPTIRTSVYGPTIDIITAPIDNIEFPTKIPGKEWVNFFDTIHISKAHDTPKKKLESSRIIEFPKNFRNYDIFKNQYEGIERARKVQKKRNKVGNVYLFSSGCYSEKVNDSRIIKNYKIPAETPIFPNSCYPGTSGNSSILPKKRIYSDTFEQSVNNNDETMSATKKSKLEEMLQNSEPMITEKSPTNSTEQPIQREQPNSTEQPTQRELPVQRVLPIQRKKPIQRVLPIQRELSVQREQPNSTEQLIQRELPNLRELMNPELLNPNPRTPELQNPDPRTPESLNLKLRQPLNPEPWNPKPRNPEPQDLELLNSEPLNLKVRGSQNLEPLNLKVREPQNLELPEISSDGSTISVNQDEINQMEKNLN